MRRKNERHTDAADRVVKDIRRQTRKRYSSEDKIRIVLAGLRGALPSYLTKQMVVLFDRKLGTQFKSIVGPKSEGIISGVAV